MCWRLTLNMDNLWTRCVSNFGRFLRKTPNAQDKNMAIKIAIIDDRVGASPLSLDDKIVTG
jgi:hypothetical protein